MKVLIVDDIPDNLLLLGTLFRLNGYEAVEARNGEEALEALSQQKMDLIISDILMPVMDGFQLCRRIKADPQLRKIPFIIYTATYTGPQDEEFALKIGADRFVEKPCEPEELMEIVRELTHQPLPEDREAPLADEGEVFKLYSERLVRKLEQKMLQAEREIEMRLKTEAALRESERRLIAAQRIARMGDFTLDMDTRIFSASVPLYELMGYDTDEVFDYERVSAAIHHPEDDAKIRKWLEETIASGERELKPAEYRVLQKNGAVLFIRTLGVIEYRLGRAPLIFATVQDITELKNAETEREKLRNQLFQSQKMESVGRLAGGVAHDFNNMLGVIIGYADLALLSLDPDDPLKGKLEEIRNAAGRSAELTRQLLTFARQQSITPRVIHINGIVDSMLKMLRRLLGEDIRLDWFPGEALWPVLMDPSQLDQILANLCVNARDAIHGVGRIRIETRNVDFGEAECLRHPDLVAGSYVMLAVSDNGCGMDRETLDRIFEPFFTTKGMEKGTGLGLATVYGIVKQNNGFITVYSEPGKGSTFRICLRRHEGETEPSRSRESSHPVPAPLGDETILLVEDEPAFLQITTTMLENQGYTVLGARGPKEAIAIAEEAQKAIALLITDVVMPGMSGPELAREIRALFPGIRCLFMSGFTRDMMRQQDVLEPGSHFIEKPFTMREFTAEVARILKGPHSPGAF